MKKLALRLDDLQVDSFSTAPAPQPGRTVKAHGETEWLDCYSHEAPCGTEQGVSCATTCFQHICDCGTGGGTCDYTCATCDGQGETCYAGCNTYTNCNTWGTDSCDAGPC